MASINTPKWYYDAASNILSDPQKSHWVLEQYRQAFASGVSELCRKIPDAIVRRVIIACDTPIIRLDEITGEAFKNIKFDPTDADDDTGNIDTNKYSFLRLTSVDYEVDEGGSPASSLILSRYQELNQFYSKVADLLPQGDIESRGLSAYAYIENNLRFFYVSGTRPTEHRLVGAFASFLPIFYKFAEFNLAGSDGYDYVRIGDYIYRKKDEGIIEKRPVIDSDAVAINTATSDNYREIDIMPHDQSDTLDDTSNISYLAPYANIILFYMLMSLHGMNRTNASINVANFYRGVFMEETTSQRVQDINIVNTESPSHRITR